jgi:hypothetical protein
MSNMPPAFHAFKDHKMEEINLSGDFRSHGEFIITPRLFSYIGDICVKSIILSDNAIRAGKRLIQQNKCDRSIQILKFLLKCL